MTQSIAISPAKLQIALSPGQIFQGQLEVSNPSTEDSLHYTVALRPFTVEDESYQLSFEDTTDFSQILSWVTLAQTSGTLAPGAKDIVAYQIAVPSDAPAGGQYLAFLVAPSDENMAQPTNGMTIKHSANIASLLYATVDGKIKQELTVLENKAKLIYLDGPIKVSSLVKNSGNTHLEASYALTIRSFLGNVRLYSTKEQPNLRTLIPGTKFYFEQTWDDTPVLGLFKVEQEIRYLDTQSSSETYVLACPTWFLVLLLAFLGSLVYALIERIFRAKVQSSDSSKPSEKAV